MPGVCRLLDTCTGHDGFPSRNPLVGSTTTFINGSPAVRVSDAWDAHSDGLTTHGGQVLTGSSFTFVNGSSLCREGDALDCGSQILTGSTTTFAG